MHEQAPPTTNMVSFMSANFVARELGYSSPSDWGLAMKPVVERFRPAETFRRRFDEVLGEIRELGFDAIDVWAGHLDGAWATREQIEVARELLSQHGLAVASLAGDFGTTATELEAACRLATSLETTILGGQARLLDDDRAAAVALLERHDVRLALENHGEPLDDLLSRVGDGDGGRVGVTLDTGHLVNAGEAPTTAIERLGEHLFHVHLKDLVSADGHDTCRLGDGVVPVEECIRALRAVGYRGAISIEDEPFDRDPRNACRESRARVVHWLSDTRSSPSGA